MSTTAPEYLSTLRDGFAGAVQQWVDQSTTAWDQWSQAWAPAAAAAGLGMPGAPAAAPGSRREHGHRHGEHGHRHGEKDCGCGDHGHRHGEKDCGCGEERSHARGCGCQDSCCRDACDCCVPDADVIVRARAGELRVVPFRLHNPWRRDREVSLEVGPWHTCSGDGLEIRAVLEEDKVVLKACEDRVVRLLVSTRGSNDAGSSSTKDDKESDDPARAQKAGTADAEVKATKPARGAGRQPVDVVVDAPRRTSDVQSCVSAYADIRFEGCARPQRVAVVVLPAECDAVEIGCDCGCCC